MAENLTRREKLVKLAADLNAVPEYYLVIFKKVGEGLEYRQTLSPGETFKRKLLESHDSFVAYKVPCDQNLRHRFSKKLLTVDSRGFTLHVTLLYGVSDPQTVVNKIERDPLRRVQEEILRILGSRAVRLDWSVIKKGARHLEWSLWHESPTTTNNALQDIQAFAHEQGIGVVNIGIARSLPEDALSERQREHDAEAEYNTESVEHALKESELRTFATARDALANRAASSAETFGDMKRALHDWKALQGSGLQSSAMPLEGLPQLVDQFPLPGGGGLPQLLSSALDHLLAIEPISRRRLFSSFFHLLGELLAEDENEERVAEYRDELERNFKTTLRQLNRDQFAFLRSLLDVDHLRNDLRDSFQHNDWVAEPMAVYELTDEVRPESDKSRKSEDPYLQPPVADRREELLAVNGEINRVYDQIRDVVEEHADPSSRLEAVRPLQAKLEELEEIEADLLEAQFKVELRFDPERARKTEDRMHKLLNEK